VLHKTSLTNSWRLWVLIVVLFAAATGIISTAFGVFHNPIPPPPLPFRAPVHPHYRNLNLHPGGTACEMRFLWHSQSPTGSVRLYRGGTFVQEIDSTTRLISAREEYYTVHKVIATGLSHSANYQYTVVGDGFISIPKNFRTGGDAYFSFIAVGDPQIGTPYQTPSVALGVWQSVLDAAMAKVPYAAFMLSVGDQLHTNSWPYDAHQGVIDGVFARSQEMYDILLTPQQFHSLPFVPVPGNHEAGSRNANGHLWHLNHALHNPPAHASYTVANTHRVWGNTVHMDYYMRWGNTVIIVMDYSTHYRPLYGSRLNWLEDTLNRNADASWRIVTFHLPPYSAFRPPDSDFKQNIIRYWIPQFQRLGIDLVLNGHCHSYSRSYNMYDNIPRRGQQFLDAAGNLVPYTTNAVLNPFGISYITINSATASGFYNVTDMAARPFLAVHNQNFMPNFSVVSVTPYTLSIATYQLNNDGSTTLVDVYTIVRYIYEGITLRQMEGSQWGSLHSAIVRSPIFANGVTLQQIENALPPMVEVLTSIRNHDFGTPEAMRRTNYPQYAYGVWALPAPITWDITSIVPPFDPGLRDVVYTISGTIHNVARGNITINVVVGNPPSLAALGYAPNNISLSHSINRASNLHQSNYCEESWRLLSDTLAFARRVYESNYVTSAQLNAAVRALDDAMFSLEPGGLIR